MEFTLGGSITNSVLITVLSGLIRRPQLGFKFK
jgi:hypothetical protein